jgi:tetratricopeptide (TPR) repeat protein
MNSSPFDQAIDHAVELALEEQKASFSSNLESFDSYAEKFRKSTREKLVDMKQHFLKGYETLLEQVKPPLDDYKMNPEKIAAISSVEKLSEILAQGRTLSEHFGYSAEVLNNFYNAAHKIVEDRRFEDGFNAYYFIITIAPFFREAWLNFGYAACQLGQYQEGIQAFGKAVELDPRSPDGYLVLAGAFLKLQEATKARQICDFGINLGLANTEEPWAQELIVQLESAKGEIYE